MKADQRAAQLTYGVTQPGDVWHLKGQAMHEVLCADNGDRNAVIAWARDRRASLLFTSPPYAQQRDYHAKIDSWTQMMQRMLLAAPVGKSAQVLVNLGLVHVDHEVMDYWRDWLLWLSCIGGRLAPSFEFVFHLNKVSRQPNKIEREAPAYTVRYARQGRGRQAAL